MPTKLDKISGIFVFFIWILITSLILSKGQVSTGVQSIRVEERQIILNWNQQVDQQDFKVNLSPQVDHKISWLGKKMFLTLEEPLEYNTTYTLSIPNYYETFFTTASKTLLAVERMDGKNRLMEINLDSQEKTALTPDNLWVTEIQKPKNSSTILFFATEAESYDEKQPETLLPELYELNLETKKIKQLTHNPNFLNFNFRSSEDGKKIILDRLELDPKSAAPKERKLWLKSGGTFKAFWNHSLSGENLFFTPDGNFLIGIDLQNFMLVAVENKDLEPQLLGEFNEAYGISPNGTKALFLQWKEGNIFAPTNEIVVLGNDGSRTILASDLGVLHSPTFSWNSQKIYFGLSKIGGTATELYELDLNTEIVQILSTESWTKVENLSLASDGKILSFECGELEICLFDLDSKKSETLSLKGDEPSWE